MVVLKTDYVDGEVFTAGVPGGTIGINATNDRLNTHTHDGGNTPLIASAGVNDILYQQFFLSGLGAVGIMNPTTSQKVFPPRIATDVASIAGGLKTTLTPTSTTFVSTGQYGPGYVLSGLGTQTTTITDPFTNLNNWAVTDLIGGGFVVANTSKFLLGSSGTGSYKTNLTTAHTVSAVNAIEYAFDNLAALAGGDNNIRIEVFVSGTSTSVISATHTSGQNADVLTFNVGSFVGLSPVVASGVPFRLRIANYDSGHVYAQGVAGNTVQNYGTVTVSSKIMHLVISGNRTAVGNDAYGYDNFLTKTSAGFASGIVEASPITMKEPTTTTIGSVLAVIQPFEFMFLPYTGLTYSASSNESSYTTGLPINQWNAIGATLGSTLTMRFNLTSTGNFYLFQGYSAKYAIQ